MQSSNNQSLRRHAVSLAAFALLAVGVSAQAGTAQLSTAGSAKGYSENAYFGAVAKNPTSFKAQYVTDATPSPDQTFWVYCIDPLTTANLASYPGTNYTTMSLDSFVKTAANGGTGYYSALFSQGQYANTNISGAGAGANPYKSQNDLTVLSKLKELYSHAYVEADPATSGNEVKVAAFQFAVWEILGTASGSYGSTTGGLRFNGTPSTAGLKAQVDTYLTALNTGNWGSLAATTSYDYTVYTTATNWTSQTLLRVTKTPGDKVPEPASLALAGVSLLGLAITRRRSAARRNAA